MSFSRRTKKIIIFSGIGLGVCLAALLIISVALGDKITSFVIKKINENLNTEIQVRKAEFSVFKRFPYAAVVFDDVLIKPNKNFKVNDSINDYFIKSKNIYVEINLIRLLFKDYSIRRIVGENGVVNLMINKDGVQNFDIFKKSDNNQKESAPINLYGILLKNFKYSYIDLKHSVTLRGLANRIQVKGTIKSDSYTFNIDTKLVSHNVLVHDVEYLQNRELETAFSLKRQGDYFTLETVYFNLESIPLTLRMSFTSNDHSQIDLISKAENVNLSGFQRLIPDEFQKYVSNFQSKGKANVVLWIKGKTYGNFLPHVDISFNIQNGIIKQTRNNIKLTAVNCSGNYNNGTANNSASSSFRINNFSSVLEKGEIRGNILYKNFNSPHVDIDLKTLIDLGDIRKFLSLDTIENLEGKLRAEIKLQAGFGDSKSYKRENIQSFNISGNAKVSDGKLKLKNSNYLYNEINSEIILGNDFLFESLALKIDNNDFFIKGRLIDAVPYLLKKNNTLNLRAELRSQNLDLTKYFEKDAKKVTTDKYDASVLFPADLLAELNVSISHFTLKKFNARNAVARVNYKPGMYTLNSSVFETMSGKVSGNGAVLQDKNNNLLVRGQTNLKRIDIKQLFYVFENFGQNILRDNHLKGSLSGDILVSCEWDSNMNFNKNTVLVESSLELANGELINFEPLEGLSRFISLSELQDIKFSTLKNQIFIRHQQIIIPQMDINSSAFNISGSGVHNFDNHYTYRINVLLSEVLARKARSNKKENSEFGIIEDDGLGKTKIPLLIVGYNNDYKISYDTKGLKEIIKESVQNQKQELKTIFKEEFGMFKNDSTVSKQKPPSKFKIEWEEQTTPAETKETEKPSKKKRKTFEEEEGYQIEFD